MEISHVVDRLHKLRYFEGYPESAIGKALKQFQKNYREGMSGPHSELFQRFPALALRVIEVDGELDGAPDLKLVFRQLANSTFKIFVPTSIKVKSLDEVILLQFSHGDTAYSFQMERESWVPQSFFDFVQKVMKKECHGLGFHSIFHPDPGQCQFFALCTKRAFNALAKAELIPKTLEAEQRSAGKNKTTETVVTATKATPKGIATLRPPADLVRAERLKLYKNGKWKIPRLSSKTVANWQDTLSFKVAANEQADRWKAIRNAFDLICASQLGLTGIGKASDYAKLLVDLVHQYLFGSWRKNYIEYGEKVSERTLLKELNCEDEILIGCICALGMNDEPSRRKFLKFLDNDTENLTPESTAFYRLLADWILNRSRWDWAKQSKIIKSRKSDKFISLLGALMALKDGDAVKFQQSLVDLTKGSRKISPVLFSNLVEQEATLMVMLGEERGVRLPDPPLKLADCLLDRSIFKS